MAHGDKTDLEGQRLGKALARAGIASRRKCEWLILAGKVEVNGVIVTKPQTLVNWEYDKIQVEGRAISGEEQKIYLLFHKPTGCICSQKRVEGKKLVLDLLPSFGRRLFTIGRLDRGTTGLLLITNDGAFAQRVIHPSANIVKEYLVKTVEEVEHAHLVRLSKGTLLEEGWVKPVFVRKVRRGTLKLGVKEGKKREVRYLVQNSGLQLVSLKRIRIGGLSLGGLPEGGWRELGERERNAIFSG